MVNQKQGTIETSYNEETEIIRLIANGYVAQDNTRNALVELEELIKVVSVKGLFLDTSKASSFHGLGADQALIKPKDRSFAPMAVLGASNTI